jgi:hypothetical protein
MSLAGYAQQNCAKVEDRRVDLDGRELVIRLPVCWKPAKWGGFVYNPSGLRAQGGFLPVESGQLTLGVSYEPVSALIEGDTKISEHVVDDALAVECAGRAQKPSILSRIYFEEPGPGRFIAIATSYVIAGRVVIRIRLQTWKEFDGADKLRAVYRSVVEQVACTVASDVKGRLGALRALGGGTGNRGNRDVLP